MNVWTICGLTALSFASFAATPASAVAYEFQLSGSRSAIFSIDQSRAPDIYTAT